MSNRGRYYSPLTGRDNSAPWARTAPTARPREEPRTKCAGLATPTNKFSSASQAHAWNTLTSSTDRSNMSNSCSHETLLHSGLQSSHQNLRVREHSCRLGSTNSCPTNAVLMSYSHNLRPGIKLSPFIGVNTSFALSLLAWISDASVSSNSSMSAILMSPFQIPPGYNT